jgi:predicted nucleic-acid-binding Zn-ribbon protein
MNFKNTTHSKMKDLVAKKYGKKSCYSCQKSYFYSPKRAIEKLKEIKLQEARSYKKPIRYYKCSKCNSYHLTSIQQDVFAELLEQRAKYRNRRIQGIATFWENKLNVA